MSTITEVFLVLLGVSLLTEFFATLYYAAIDQKFLPKQQILWMLGKTEDQIKRKQREEEVERKTTTLPKLPEGKAWLFEFDAKLTAERMPYHRGDYYLVQVVTLDENLEVKKVFLSMHIIVEGEEERKNVEPLAIKAAWELYENNLSKLSDITDKYGSLGKLSGGIRFGGLKL